jgi:phage terminase Nu1 subunit (DNA packaging protein)
MALELKLSKQELSELAGYTYRQLHNIDTTLRENGKAGLFPEKDADGKYDARDFVQNWVAYKVSAAENGSDDLEAVKARHEAVKMQKSEIQLALMKGEVVDARETVKLWADIATSVRTRLMNLPKQLAPKLVMIGDARIIEANLEESVREALALIADTPLPKELETDGEETEDAEE